MYGCAAKQFTAVVGSGAADAELGGWMITQEEILTNF